MPPPNPTPPRAPPSAPPSYEEMKPEDSLTPSRNISINPGTANEPPAVLKRFIGEWANYFCNYLMTVAVIYILFGQTSKMSPLNEMSMDCFGRWVLLVEMHSILVPHLPYILFSYPIIFLVYSKIPRLQKYISVVFFFRFFVTFLVIGTTYLSNAFCFTFVINTKYVSPNGPYRNLVTFLSNSTIPPLLVTLWLVSLVFFDYFLFNYLSGRASSVCKTFWKAFLGSILLPMSPTIISITLLFTPISLNSILPVWIGFCTVMELFLVYFFVKLSSKFRAVIDEDRASN